MDPDYQIEPQTERLERDVQDPNQRKENSLEFYNRMLKWKEKKDSNL